MKTEKIPKNVADAFAAIDKLNPESAILSDNALSIVNEFIDTGSMALNAILSGSLHKGVPKGRIIGLVGPTGCGKTLILNKIIGNAQRKDPDVWGIIWDSENAEDAEIARNVGANPNRIKHNPVATVEDCRNQICAFLDMVKEHKELYGKFVIGIDSLGNLASSKELKDAAAGKDAVDMGLRAKTIKSMMRVLTNKCAMTNTTLIFTNHVYDDPMCLYPSMIKNQSGGKGPLYLASVLVQLSVKSEKAEDSANPEDILPLAHKVNGVILSAMTVKNRHVPPFLKTELFLNFQKGLDKYSGLKDMAVGFGILKATGPTFELDGEKIGYAKTWEHDPAFWDTKILPKLETVLNKQIIYSQLNDTTTTPEQS